MMPSFFTKIGIWERLLLAFSTIAAITVLSVLTALFLLESSSDIFATITEKNLPELAQVADVAETSGQIIAIAPNLASAPDEDTQKKIRADLDVLLRQFSAEVNLLGSTNPQLRREIDDLLVHLNDNLFSLQLVVADRLREERRLQKHMERLRWLYSDMLEEIEPLSQDLNYNFDADIDRIRGAVGQGEKNIAVARLRSNRMFKKIVDRIGSSGDLLVSLLLQASSAQTVAHVDNLAALASDTIASLRLNLEHFSEEASALTLHQVFSEVLSRAEGADGVFALKKRILANNLKGQEILTENTIIVGQLRSAIRKIVTRTQDEALSAAAVTKDKLEHARWAQLGLVFFSLIIASCVLWFYVRGSIVARLNALATSMQAIAGGDLKYAVPEAGDDEIGKMAGALRVFRDTAQEVEEANAQAIIDNAAVGLVIADPDGVIRFFNTMALSLFDSEPHEMIGQQLFSFVTEPERQAFSDACSLVFFSKDYSQVVALYCGVKRDGSEFPMEAVIRPVQQRAQRNLLITLHDVTEREEAQELLRKRVRQKTDHLSRINVKLRQEVRERRRVQDELVQAGKLAALGQLSAGIAHELNQPLSAIRYYLHNARLLIERGKLDLHQENIEKIDELSARMAGMINHLKKFARLPSNKLHPVDVVPVIEQSLALLKSRIKEDEIEIERRYDDAPHVISAEDIRLEQVLVNIIGNAIDAIGLQNDGERKIAVDVTDAEENVCIEIVDTGPGIPPEVKESIFDPFYTTKEVGKGLGLGLSISYNIVKDMRGEINAVNAENGGTKFVLSFQKAVG
ncbi:ATP-binding protein [Halodesulfovibrio marinisediminis]|uniref:C4-dicarboxylate transport sensor protein DctB n=1 Tax=Halodesulfovibrio marinisediminis DSM 17456 TaxID=1121457 RepID=A0A1N6I7R1_9BACT|nr:ATP-binding protein [Halodesulfovibrio marinisediminis]SIO28054.1 two-component system, NtrC family, phosphoglycerate transport system sensor histidine kinase PgtB [Halodesulfovibrio marinisediminis DSM 17456]